MNDVKKTIGWCDKTWNVVSGCRRGCPYCYAKRIHDRFDPHVPFSHIEFHEGRLLDKMPRAPSKIFVGSMSDIEYWEKEWVERILDVCRQNKRHTFMFLSKEPHSYRGFEWPENTMQGLTETKVDNPIESYEVMDEMVHLPRPFLSIEPLLGMFFCIGGKGKLPDEYELVIVGAMTGPGAIFPRQEWIESVRMNVPAEKIYWKRNIQRYL